MSGVWHVLCGVEEYERANTVIVDSAASEGQSTLQTLCIKGLGYVMKKNRMRYNNGVVNLHQKQSLPSEHEAEHVEKVPCDSSKVKVQAPVNLSYVGSAAEALRLPPAINPLSRHSARGKTRSNLGRRGDSTLQKTWEPDG